MPTGPTIRAIERGDEPATINPPSPSLPRAGRLKKLKPEPLGSAVNDAHLNQTMAYLTACTFYGTLFHGSPEGLTFGQVTDNRFDAKQKDKDRDGGNITRVFSAKDRTDLQRIAWDGLGQFIGLAKASH